MDDSPRLNSRRTTMLLPAILVPLAFGMPGPFDWIVIAFIGLLLFGKRLPEVGRSIGKTIVEFKKGMKEVENEVHDYPPPAPTPPPAQQARPVLTQNYKFDPYTGKPISQETAETTTPPST